MFRRASQQLILCCAETEVVCAMNTKASGDLKQLNVIGRYEKQPGSDIDMTRLLAGMSRNKAKVAFVAPLNQFSIVNVTVPALPREAVARMLPYTLSKVLSSPVSEFLYDWQISQQFKDRLELTVYLFPVLKYNAIKQSLSEKQKEVVWFEPDIFSGFSLLEATDEDLSEPAILLLLWKHSISIGVYEKDEITLVRSVELNMPQDSPDEIKKKSVEKKQEIPGKSIAPGGGTVSEDSEESYDPFFSPESDNILAGFDLLHGEGEGEEKQAVSENREKVDDSEGSWEEYLETIGLEILRTGDYHTSVLKGKAPAKLYIGGAECCFQQITKLVRQGQNLQVEKFPPNKIESECSQLIAGLCLGVLQR